MEPVKFAGHNYVYGSCHPGVLALPAYKAIDGTVVSCWTLTWRDRLRMLFTGRVWLLIKTYNQPLQPQSMCSDYPFQKLSDDKKGVEQ